MAVTQRIRECRRKLGMTQEMLSSLIGVSLKTVQRWEAGQRSPRVEELKRLAEALNTTVDYLMGQSDDAPARVSIEPAKSLKEDSVSDVGMAYWGGVIDNAEKIARLGNMSRILEAQNMLKMALNRLGTVLPTTMSTTMSNVNYGNMRGNQQLTLGQ